MKEDTPGPKGYNTIWIQFGSDIKDRHQLFLKEHSVRNQLPEHPRGRTLFVLNVPPYVTTVALSKAFHKQCGEIEAITFTTLKGFKTAYIVFREESTLEKALELPKYFILLVNIHTNKCTTGLEKWRKEYNESLCDEEKLKKEIEDYMNNYDAEVAATKAREKAAQEKEDDGWVTVTSNKKRGQFGLARKESTINKLQQVDEVKKKKKQLLNFYSFQIREAKRENLAELRKKFELDKQRLQELKSKRTFKPF